MANTVTRREDDVVIESWEMRVRDRLRHPPQEMWWSPDVTLHLRRWHPLFWLVLLFGWDR